MSIESARQVLESAREFASGEVQAFAGRVLATWDEVSAAALRMREYRARRASPSYAPVTPAFSNGASQQAQPERNETRNEASPSSLSISPLGLNLSLETERGSGVHAVTPAAVTPRDAAPKRKHRYPETTAPDPADAPAFGAWCATWKLDPSSPSVIAMATYHYGKGTLWRDWCAAHRTWTSRERSNGARKSPWVQPVPASGRAWKAGDGT
jgi:hypothetical protein